jgi:tRNA(adenine34) deaminase
MPSDADDEKFMRLALEEAAKAAAHDDIPVGAVLVKDGQVLASGHNERELLSCPVAHAEVQALNAGAGAQKHWNLTGTILYVTLEPCPMCAGALVMARVEELVYAASDPKGGAISLQIPILENPALNHRLKVRKGPFSQESAALLQEFFRKKRQQKAAMKGPTRSRQGV